MKIAVASGKGGTGKTTVAVALALVARKPVTLLDCDVEEPNCHLFLKNPTPERRDVSVLIPEIDAIKCDNCGKCSKFCQFNAIASLGVKTLIFPELCHSCGGCAKICPKGAISEKAKKIGTVEKWSDGSMTMATGILDIGQHMSPPLIREVLKNSASSCLTIIDCPPGTSCPMVAALHNADYVLMVTEPTPFGLHDLKLAVETVREIGIPCAVIINRSGSNDGKVEAYCASNNLPILLKIPDNRKVAEGYSRGETLVQSMPEISAGLLDVLENVENTFK